MSANPTIVFEDRVRERDLDHFLMEELQASTSFRDWFVGHLSNRFSAPPKSRVRTQLSPERITDSRQTDVLLAYYDQHDNLVAAIFIESKVTDGFQVGQAEAYEQEVMAWRKRLGTDRAASVLVSPRSNRRLDRRDLFDAHVEIDSMADQVKARLEQTPEGELRDRLAVRADLLDALAGKRSGNGWTPQPVMERVKTAGTYERLVREVLPDHHVSPTSAGPKAVDRFFALFPECDRFRGRVEIKHRLYEGFVCLQFRTPLVADKLARLPLPSGFSVQRAGGSVQIRLPAPPLPRGEDDPENQIRAGLVAIRQLTDWFGKNVPHLNDAIAPGN